MALQFNKTSPALRLAREARALWENGCFPDAIRKLEEAAAREPSNPEICLGLGKAYGARFDFTSAEQWFSKALTLAPDSAKIHFQAALDWNQINQVKPTESCLQKVLQLQPGHPGALLMLAEIHEHQHDLAMATQELTQLRALQPQNPGASFLLAKIARREGKLESAEKPIGETTIFQQTLVVKSQIKFLSIQLVGQNILTHYTLPTTL